MLGQTLPWTVGLLGAATVISFALGTLAGIALGWRRGSWLDGLLPVSTFFQAVPYFFLGTVLLLVLGSDLHWFPVLGNYARGLTPGFNWAVHRQRGAVRRAARASRSCSARSPAGCSACGT